MKKHLLLFIVFTLFLGCSESSFNNKNPYIPNYTFTIDINMNLPAYSNLQYPSNAIYYAGVGEKGIYIFNTGSGYNAFDAAFAHTTISSCSDIDLKRNNFVLPFD